MLTGTGRLSRVPGSNRCRWPACSYAICPAPADAFTMGKSAWSVTCSTRPLAGSNENRLNSPLRSDRKYTMSPIHMGSVSLQRPSGCGICCTE